MRIDLGARKFGSDLALAELLLGDKLPQDLRQEMKENLRRRIITPYLKSCQENDRENQWITSTSNWNSVCTSGSVFVILATSERLEERLAAIGSALNSMKHYLSGLGDDGYCSEGIGYWGYGFGHYLYLAQILSDYTEGQIDLFTFHHPEKLKRVARFPENFMIQNGVFPAFSDNNIKNPSSFGNFAKAMTAHYYGSSWPFNTVHEQATEQLIQWSTLADDHEGYVPDLPDHSYFEHSGVVTSRGRQPVPFSIALKTGHNAENHNHNDVGSYSLILGDDLIAGDIGKPVYIAGAFSSKNKARSSWGHPVPEVDGKLQSKGASFHGAIESTEFSKNSDRITMDIRPAYEVDALRKLIRVIENDKSGEGCVTIEDTFQASSPILFGTTLMTYAKYKRLDSHTILLETKNQRATVEITSSQKFEIHSEDVPVRLGSGKIATRLALSFIQPADSGFISIEYKPAR